MVCCRVVKPDEFGSDPIPTIAIKPGLTFEKELNPNLEKHSGSDIRKINPDQDPPFVKINPDPAQT